MTFVRQWPVSATISAIPRWLFPMPLVDLHMLEKTNDPQRKISKDLLVKQIKSIIIVQCTLLMVINPESGHTAVVVVNPLLDFKIKSNFLSVYSSDLVDIHQAP